MLSQTAAKPQQLMLCCWSVGHVAIRSNLSDVEIAYPAWRQT
jgi:hypothetical protein